MKKVQEDINKEPNQPESLAGATTPGQAATTTGEYPQVADGKGKAMEAKLTDSKGKATDSQNKATGSKGGEAKSEGLSLKEVIEEQAIEGEAPQSRMFSLRKILGGDILNTTFVRRQIWLFLLIAGFLILYIGSRYSCQQDLIKIDKLQAKLKDAKYRALSSTSQLTEISRESNVLNLLKNNKDSVLKIASEPPYKIEVPQEDQ